MRLPDSLPLLSLDFAGTTWRFWRERGHFFARPDDLPLDFAACVIDHDGSLWRSWNEAPREARARLQATLRNEGFFRAVSLGEGEAILLHRAQAFASNAGGELARFEVRGARFRQTRFLLETSSEELQSSLKRERNRTASDLRAAFAWLDAPPDERLFFGLSWTTGDGATLRRLVFAGFWSSDELWAERGQLEYRLAATPGSEFGAETSFVDAHPLPRPRFRAAPFRLARLLQKVVVRNRPFLPRGVRLNREVGSGPLAGRETNKTGVIRFAVGAPNAHEMLEARLDLRDWLRDEAPELMGEWF